jgi:Tol biopolymer transport system component
MNYRTLSFSLFSVILLYGLSFGQTSPDAQEGANLEANFLSSIRRLTHDGPRAGEGYYNSDGTLMVFQSERMKDNPFYQIYLMDFDTGDVETISPGHGKTTCAWIHPDNNQVMFASTHHDPTSRQQQLDLIKLRQDGNEPRYSWDYDHEYEIYSFDRTTKEYQRLTKTKGYDAEGSYSPDGTQIAFASNRRAYSHADEMTEKQKKLFEQDKAFMMDIYIMNADGTNIRRLTDVPGYDGGPFFSPDGKKICWRRFSEAGDVAEIMTMNIDGSEPKQLTRMGRMSWAPYFHPSGKYLIFNTNKFGFSNFELFLIDTEGKSNPLRITNADGFDGLASWTPDGKTLTWSSNRHDPKERKNAHIYVANWNHENALKALGLDGKSAEEAVAIETALKSADSTSAGFEPLDMMKHVDYLCHPTLQGRMTGSPGERKATAYAAAYLDYLGVQPAGDDGTWYQEFDFPAGAKLGPKNSFKILDQNLTLDKDWRPLTFSQNGDTVNAQVVFAGYGIVAPADKDKGIEEYDSYVHLDVEDKWVLAFRYMPENVDDKVRQHLQYHSSLRKKAMDARDKGARGIIFVSGPNSFAKQQLVPLARESSRNSSSVGVISISDNLANKILTKADKDLKTLQDKLDTGEPMMGFPIKDVRLSCTVEVEKVTGRGRNIVGRLQVGDQPSNEAILVGAHIDHLGVGRGSSSLARDDEKTMIHFGADDNASGVAAMLEIAEYLTDLRKKGKLNLKRDVIFAGWSGEELGLHGSAHFVETMKKQIETRTADPSVNEKENPHASSIPQAALGEKDPHAGLFGPKTIYPNIAACLNMDMVGRYEERLVIQGMSSSSYWSKAVERNAAVGLELKLSNDTQLPTDATSFFQAGVPILSAFTGSHTDYHTPRDTPDKLNYDDAARIAKLMGLITRALATEESAPDYIAAQAVADNQPRANMRAFLGTVPDYGDDVVGVKISGATDGTPAHKAGLQGGDVITELAGRKIENIYDYTYAIEALKIGQETTITVNRGGESIKMKITPGRR